MKKHKNLVISIVVVVVVFVVAMILFNTVFCFNVGKVNASTASFSYLSDEEVVTGSLSEEDSKIIADIFSNEDIVYDSGNSCTFEDKVSITFGEGLFAQKFYPSLDGAHTIKYKGKYFYLSDNTAKKLISVLKKYGMEIHL